MKRLTRIISLLVLCFLICVPAISAKAATQPVQPSGLGVYGQSKSGIIIDFAFDSNLPYYSPENPYSYGYEVTISNLKGKVIAVLDTSYNTDMFKIEDSNTIAVILSGNKYIKQPFVYKVRSFVCDQNNQRIYSEYSKEKVVVPRARVYDLKALTRSSGRIKWKKVKGAKKYSIYLSSNGKKYKKYGSSKSNSIVINNMQLNKTYYVYAVAEGIKYKKKTVKPYKAKNKDSAVSKIRIRLKYN